MTEQTMQGWLTPGRRVHLVGIGGVSMAPLAEVLAGQGLVVTGSDMNDSKAVAQLRALGIPVSIGHGEENLGRAELVIRTAAARDDNPEIVAARHRCIPVFERAQAWGEIMKAYPRALCISGTHGKTTTTSMCAHIALAAELDPTVMIGGTLPLLGAGHRVGGGDTIILESCEYCNSFLSFSPTIAVILNIEADHLDFFKDLEDVEHSFRAFGALVPEGTGLIVANGEDANTMAALAGLDRPLRTFGVEEGDVHAKNLTWHSGLPTFDVVVDGEVFATVSLSVPGLHNVKNALAASAAAQAMGVSGAAVAAGLGAFSGAGRRFEYKGECNGAAVYDDYAHHPGELRPLLETAAGLGYRRVICAFQPHTYTRTQALLEEFVQVLALPDVTLLAEIYAARETNDSGITSRDLVARIPGAEAFDTLGDLTAALRRMAAPGDLILTVGAGDVYTVGEALTEN